MTWLATSSETSTCASTVDAPRCGVRSAFGALSSGEPVGGSCSKTSIPAPASLLAERVGHRGLVDHAATRNIEQDRPGLHPRQRLAADEVLRGAAQRDVDADHVGPFEQLGHLDEHDAVVLGLLGRDVRVRGEDIHLHRPCPSRDRLADLAEPDDAERPAAQFQTGELGAPIRRGGAMPRPERCGGRRHRAARGCARRPRWYCRSGR